MASNRKPPYTAKAIIWTETARSEMEGPTKAITYYMFMSVPKEDRQQLLDALADWHAKN